MTPVSTKIRHVIAPYDLLRLHMEVRIVNSAYFAINKWRRR